MQRHHNAQPCKRTRRGKWTCDLHHVDHVLDRFGVTASLDFERTEQRRGYGDDDNDEGSDESGGGEGAAWNGEGAKEKGNAGFAVVAGCKAIAAGLYVPTQASCMVVNRFRTNIGGCARSTALFRRPVQQRRQPWLPHAPIAFSSILSSNTAFFKTEITFKICRLALAYLDAAAALELVAIEARRLCSASRVSDLLAQETLPVVEQR